MRSANLTGQARRLGTRSAACISSMTGEFKIQPEDSVVHPAGIWAMAINGSGDWEISMIVTTRGRLANAPAGSE